MKTIQLLVTALLLNFSAFAQWGNIAPAPGQVMDMMFLNGDTGFAAISDWGANTGNVYRTTDKGANWTTIFTMTGSVKSVFFTSYTNGYIATGTSDLCQRTTDAGATWTPFNSIMFNSGKLRFRDGTTGFGLNQGSADVSYTRDGGATWESYPFGRFTEGIEDYSSPSANAAFVLTWNGMIYKSTSDTNWVFQSQVAGTKGIDFVDANNGYLISTGQLYETSDGGVNWNSISTNGGYDITYAGPNTLYLVDGSASIAKSTDNGLNFTTMTGTNNNIMEVQVAGNEAYAFGTVYRLGAPMAVSEALPNQTTIGIYPNPNSGNFTLDMGAVRKKATIAIRDMAGRTIHTETYRQRQVLDLNIELPAGIYLVSAQLDDITTTVRMVVE